jgi:hypothetical protein
MRWGWRALGIAPGLPLPRRINTAILGVGVVGVAIATSVDEASLARWRAYGRCHQGALAIKRGYLDVGLRLLRADFDELGGSKPALRVNAVLMAGRAGQTADGLAAVEGRWHGREHRRTLGNIRGAAPQDELDQDETGLVRIPK